MPVREDPPFSAAPRPLLAARWILSTGARGRAPDPWCRRAGPPRDGEAHLTLGERISDLADGTAHLLGLLEPFAPYATSVAALVAAVIALFTLDHRRRADSRAEGWRRVEHAMDLTREQDQVGRNTGMQLLDHLLDDTRWDEVDVRTLAEADQILITEVVDGLTLECSDPEPAIGSERLLGGLRRWITRRRSRGVMTLLGDQLGRARPTPSS